MTRVLRWAWRIALALVAVGVVYVGVTFAQVVWAANQHDASPASAIVVMGAAQWDGRPSPVLAARLDHAAELWELGLAPVIIVTGGKQSGDRTTQGLTGYQYLRDLGVPDGAIRVEVDGTNSYEELSASALIVRNEDLPPEVIIVSSPYHALRVAGIADEVGLGAHVAPTDSSSPLPSLMRETAAVSLGRIVGYRRLSSLS
jgi:uncharacterized SAM-binding protein YcdF (DUF218 family)